MDLRRPFKSLAGAVLLLALFGGEARETLAASGKPSSDSGVEQAKAEAQAWAQQAERKLKDQKKQEALGAKRQAEAAPDR